MKVKFFEFGEDEKYFIRNELNLLVGFIDPQALSFHNFENIINIDSLFEKEKPLFETHLWNKHPKGELYTFKLKKVSSTNILSNLDKCNLYVVPINTSQRGGRRFIFNSTYLGDTLTDLFKSKDSLFNEMKELTTNFEMVNYIFI